MNGAFFTSATGFDILRRRHAQSAKAVYDALTMPLDLPDFDLRNWRSVITTGVGSSAAHARYLGWLLRNYASVPAWDVSTGAFMHEPRTLTREQALVVFEGLGAPLWAEKTRAELARISGRRATDDDLTETEKRVASLAAEGRTNKEIAATLFMGVSTVEAHLSHVYRKLGIHSRAALGPQLETAAKPVEGTPQT